MCVCRKLFLYIGHGHVWSSSPNDQSHLFRCKSLFARVNSKNLFCEYCASSCVHWTLWNSFQMVKSYYANVYPCLQGVILHVLLAENYLQPSVVLVHFAGFQPANLKDMGAFPNLEPRVIHEYPFVSAIFLVQDPLQSHKMAPKAKTAMKAKPLSKGKFAMNSILKKTKCKNTFLKKEAGSSKDKKPATKKPLNKRHCQTVQYDPSREKIERTAETAHSPEEAAKRLKKVMTQQEHSQAWLKLNIHMRGKSKKEQKEFHSLSKGEKGMEDAMYLLKANVPKFMHWKGSLGQSVSIDKREGWKSETLEQFGEYGLQLHIESCSVECREYSWTVGVWNYRDKGDLVKRTRVTKNKEYSKGVWIRRGRWTRVPRHDGCECHHPPPNKKLGEWAKGLVKRLWQKGSRKRQRPVGHQGQEEGRGVANWGGGVGRPFGKAKRAKDHMASAKADLDAIEEAEKSWTQKQFARKWLSRRKWWS